VKHYPADPFECEYRDRGRRLPGSSRAGMLRGLRAQADDGFICRHCGVFVSSAIALAGVINRNHCPYCLWSRHLDLERPGDRLSACKALMRPAGLTQKRTQKRYDPGSGELMLVHYCTECDRISINRLAADDDPDLVFAVFERSLAADPIPCEIEVLDLSSRELVHTQLFGRE